MKRRTVDESRSKIDEISRELATIGAGAAALEGVEQELGGAVGVYSVLSVYSVIVFLFCDIFRKRSFLTTIRSSTWSRWRKSWINILRTSVS